MPVLLLATFLVAGSAYSQNNPEITIFKDEEAITVTTAKEQVGEILKLAEVDINEYHKVYPDVDEVLETGYIYIETGKKVTVLVDGEEEEVISWEDNVKGVLSSLQLELDDDDFINLDKETVLKEGLEIHITRVEKDLVYEEEEIDFETRYVDNSSVTPGGTEVKSEGSKGLRKKTFEYVFYDGEKVSREMIKDEIVKEPKDRVIYVGPEKPEPKPPREERPPQPSRGGSGRVSKAIGTTYTGSASYYGSELHGNRTANGEVFDKNQLTAAHPFLEFGTIVRVTLKSTGRSVDVRINDDGPHVSGRIIDLSKAAAREIGLVGPGIGDVKVEVIK
ncbi:septal ring lytic transglycosylase RlpA family protein [Proteinivorax hydrogeniformans]|uniref:Probable endolytic peptidoglycan transglycosylase RlpA n=1 Tax=Proteinivorax hydrogeniformans TaxID=1826727 RepID=A0AAU8HQZ1_9FIRM